MLKEIPFPQRLPNRALQKIEMLKEIPFPQRLPNRALQKIEMLKEIPFPQRLPNRALQKKGGLADHLSGRSLTMTTKMRTTYQ